MHSDKVLKLVRLTEKANKLSSELGQYTFEVFPTATKGAIAQAVEQAFKVTVKRVNVQIRSTMSGQPTVFVNGVGRASPAAPGTTLTLNVAGDQGAAFPAVTGWTGVQDMSFTNMSWADPLDLNFTTSVEYDR